MNTITPPVIENDIVEPVKQPVDLFTLPLGHTQKYQDTLYISTTDLTKSTMTLALPTPEDDKVLASELLDTFQAQKQHKHFSSKPSQEQQESSQFRVQSPNSPYASSRMSSRRGSLSLEETVPMEILDILRRHPLLQTESPNLTDTSQNHQRSDDFISDVIKNLNPVSYNIGDQIIVQGETAKAMFFLLRGTVIIGSRDGESTYAEIQAGGFFGEIGILFGRPRTASVIAKTRCLCVSLTKEGLESVLPKYPEIKHRLVSQAEERLKVLDSLKKQISQDLSESTAYRVLSNLDIRQHMSKVPAFRHLNDEMLHKIAMSVEYRCYPPYSYIIRQGNEGTECFFIILGTVEVIHEIDTEKQEILATLSHGCFFGEMALLQKVKRTASVRTISQVDCLILQKDHMLSLIEKYPAIGLEMRRVAKLREDANKKTIGGDILPMSMSSDEHSKIFCESPSSTTSSTKNDGEHNPFIIATRVDPDPFQPHVVNTPTLMVPILPDSNDAFKQRSLKRRASAISLRTDTVDEIEMAVKQSSTTLLSPLRKQPKLRTTSSTLCTDQEVRELDNEKEKGNSPETQSFSLLQLDLLSLTTSTQASHRLHDQDLARIFFHIGDVVELMRLRLVSKRWATILSTHPGLIQSIDLTKRTCRVDDVALGYITRFGNKRIRAANLKGCFHVTDMGFSSLIREAPLLESLSINSCWEISAEMIGQIPLHCSRLRYIDVGNCRKVNDLAMAHLVLGCPFLTHFELSYCKSLTDNTLQLLAKHASHRIEHLSLNRLTTMTSAGFESWLYTRFPRLHTLILSDCSYLNDHVILAISTACVHPVENAVNSNGNNTASDGIENNNDGESLLQGTIKRTSKKIPPPLNLHAIPSLRALNLSFCCSLTDAALDCLTTRCLNLEYLNVAFCGSAVSDMGLVKIAQRLKHLKEIMVRGCVRVTNLGISALLHATPIGKEETRGSLYIINATQCRNVDRTAWDVQGIRNRGIYLLL